jgi:hypothetical protein
MRSNRDGLDDEAIRGGVSRAGRENRSGGAGERWAARWPAVKKLGWVRAAAAGVLLQAVLTGCAGVHEPHATGATAAGGGAGPASAASPKGQAGTRAGVGRVGRAGRTGGAVRCDQCRTTWVLRSEQMGKLTRYSRQEVMVCKDCDSAVTHWMKTGHLKHYCSHCKGHMTCDPQSDE